MAKNINTRPTIGGAAKILGVSKQRLESLFRAGKTPAVKRDERGVRRYSTLALQQARKYLFPGAGFALKEHRSIVFLSYVVGAGIAWLVRPQLSAFLGIPITLLLINQFIKMLDIQISDKSSRLKKNSVIGAISIVSLLLGIGTVYVAPTISEYAQVMVNCIRHDARIDDLCGYTTGGSNIPVDDTPSPGAVPTDTLISTPSPSATEELQPSAPPMSVQPTRTSRPHRPVDPSATESSRPPTSASPTPGVKVPQESSQPVVPSKLPATPVPAKAKVRLPTTPTSDEQGK